MPPKNTNKKLKKSLQAQGMEEWIAYIQSPKRIMWSNFLAGLFRGLGTIIGMTVVFGLLIWSLGFFVDFPLIGAYFKNLKDSLEGFGNMNS